MSSTPETSPDVGRRPLNGVRLPLLQMDDYTRGAKVYWWAVALLGGLALALAIGAAVQMRPGDLVELALGVALAALTGLYPVRIPGSKTSGSVAEIFIFLLMLELGPAAAVIAAATETATISFRTSTRWTSRLGSPAMTALSMGISATGFVTVRETLAANGHAGAGVGFTLLLAFALLYFAMSTLLVASLFKLKRGEPIRPIAVLRDHAWMALLFAGSGSIAGMFNAALGALGIAVLPTSAPVIALLLYLVHRYFRQMEAESAMRDESVRRAEQSAAESARRVRELRESEERFESAFRHAAIGVVLVSTEGVVLQVNDSLARLLGRSPESITGAQLQNLIHPEDRHELRAQMQRLVDEKESTFSTTLRCVHKGGIDVWMSASGAMFTARSPLSRCLILQLQDSSARRQAESRLQYLAYHDPLSDLPNRGFFLEALGRAIAGARAHRERRYAVLIFDLDRFKLVNDSLGHGVGDRLLVEVAGRLQTSVRSCDVVARLGGDEFAILIEDAEPEAAAIRLAERVREVLAQPVYLQDIAITTSASIGITTSVLGYESPDDVIRDADTAMYRAKAQPSATCVVFDNKLHADVAERLWLESELRLAISGEQLHLNYQPIHDLASGRLVGFEALARWFHPERGNIGPDRFIRVAEETGQIIPLGTWAMRTACAQLARWQSAQPSCPRVTMHVNVSGMQLAQPDFVRCVFDAIDAAGIEPWQLTIELTETVLVNKLAFARPHLTALRKRGVHVSIDDFGTGFSSFSMLGQLPIDSIKIDRSFVADLGRDPSADAIVAGIIALARTLDKTLVAEGIETVAQLRRLEALGCHSGQGYLLGRPSQPAIAESTLRTAHLTQLLPLLKAAA